MIEESEELRNLFTAFMEIEEDSEMLYRQDLEYLWIELCDGNIELAWRFLTFDEEDIADYIYMHRCVYALGEDE